jgi:hypothetical protein
VQFAYRENRSSRSATCHFAGVCDAKKLWIKGLQTNLGRSLKCIHGEVLSLIWIWGFWLEKCWSGWREK